MTILEKPSETDTKRAQRAKERRRWVATGLVGLFLFGIGVFLM